MEATCSRNVGWLWTHYTGRTLHLSHWPYKSFVRLNPFENIHWRSISDSYEQKLNSLCQLVSENNVMTKLTLCPKNFPWKCIASKEVQLRALISRCIRFFSYLNDVVWTLCTTYSIKWDEPSWMITTCAFWRTQQERVRNTILAFDWRDFEKPRKSQTARLSRESKVWLPNMK
jgi:hypothetical protein